MRPIPALLLLAATGLAACATPDENTLTRADLRAAEADVAFAESLAFTPIADIPVGQATYTGSVSGDVIVNGEDDFSLLGDLVLDIDIAEAGRETGRNNISGTIDNLNLFDDGNDGFDDQRLSGDLRVSGRADSGRIDATATGLVTAVITDTLSEQRAAWELDLNGDFLGSDGSVILGDVSGGTTEDVTNDYALRFDGPGDFFGEAGN